MKGISTALLFPAKIPDLMAKNSTAIEINIPTATFITVKIIPIIGMSARSPRIHDESPHASRATISINRMSKP